MVGLKHRIWTHVGESISWNRNWQRCRTRPQPRQLYYEPIRKKKNEEWSFHPTVIL